MTINDISKELGLTKRAIKFYEEKGLLSVPKDENGYRNYSQEHIRILKTISVYRKLGIGITHTHVPGCEDFSGITLLNPGSLSLPRDGTNGSYAIIRSTEDEFYTNIIYYDTVCGTKKRQEKKVKGGMLRDMLNYSDRF